MVNDTSASPWEVIDSSTKNVLTAINHIKADDYQYFQYRVKMKTEKSAKVIEQLTISIDAKGSKGTLKIAWDDTVASIPVMMH